MYIILVAFGNNLCVTVSWVFRLLCLNFVIVPFVWNSWQKV